MNICKVCEKEVPPLGMACHLKWHHQLTSLQYREKYELNSKCLVCGTSIPLNRKFCGMKCVGVYQTGKTKIRRAILTFSAITERLKEEVISSYQKNISTMADTARKYGISVEALEKIFKEKSIVPREPLAVGRIRHEQKIEAFLETPTGGSLIRSYSALGGNIRKSSRMTGFDRKRVKRLLVFNGVHIKDVRTAKREVDALAKIEGRHGHRFGKTPPAGTGKAHWYIYKGLKFQGSWEFKFALWLESRGIKFFCHRGVKRFVYDFEGTLKTYCPDFYIPQENRYVEIKGYYSEFDRQKIGIIRRTYPINLSVYLQSDLESLGVLSIDKTMDINLSDHLLKKGVLCP